MLSPGTILSNGEANRDALGLDERDSILAFLPIAHSFERTGGYYTVMTGGGTTAYAEGLTQIAQNLLEIEPTLVLTVPRLLEVIYARVMRTVESAPPLRRKLFHIALSTGGKSDEYCPHRHAPPAHTAVAVAHRPPA